MKKKREHIDDVMMKFKLLSRLEKKNHATIMREALDALLSSKAPYIRELLDEMLSKEKS